MDSDRESLQAEKSCARSHHQRLAQERALTSRRHYPIMVSLRKIWERTNRSTPTLMTNLRPLILVSRMARAN